VKYKSSWQQTTWHHKQEEDGVLIEMVNKEFQGVIVGATSKGKGCKGAEGLRQNSDDETYKDE